MRTHLRNPKDFWSGLVFIAVGLAFLIIGQGYDIGTSRRMGPGYFPMVLSILMILVGIGVTARSFLKDGAPIGAIAIKPMILVVGATIVFGLLVRSAGLLPASIILVAASAFASPSFKYKEAIFLSIGLAVFCALVFTRGLGLPIPVIGPLLGG